MAKKKHGPPHEEHADESWLLPYSDMMTLLLALFIVMFAVSSVDQDKYNAFMEAMYTAFGGTANEGSPVATYPGDLPSQSALEDLINSGGAGALSNLYSSLNEYVQDSGLSDSIQVERQGDNVLVVLKNDVFFEPGSAELSPEMREQADMLAQVLSDNEDPEHPFDVIVAGHTDNVPINNAQFPSNWHLSVQRAVNFLMEMLSDSDLNPTHFSSRGYGEFLPVADNSTAEGRQKNRRVELLISQAMPQAGDASSAASTPAPPFAAESAAGANG